MDIYTKRFGLIYHLSLYSLIILSYNKIIDHDNVYIYLIIDCYVHLSLHIYFISSYTTFNLSPHA